MKNNYFFLLRFLFVVALTASSAKPLFAQTTLAAGDIAFVRYISADDGSGGTQNDEFTFVLLKDIASGTVINFTDYGWTSAGKFQETFGSATCGAGNHGSRVDGIVSWSATAAYTAGRQITVKCKYNPSANVGTATGVQTSAGQTYYMSLPTGGDQIFAYQGTFASPALIAGISINKNWDASLQPCDYTATQSVLPAALSNSNVAIYNAGDDAFSAYYNCSTSSTGAASLRTAINTASNWITNNNDNSDSSIPIPPAFLSTQCTLSVVTTQITGQPASKTACAGSGTTFTVAASNDATGYQWQLFSGGNWGNLSNTAPYSGVTSATLVISNVAGLNGNQYRAIVTGATSATSASATLTVGSSPQNISLTPSGTLSCNTTTVTLTATSTGGTSYVFSGVGITGQNSNTATVNQTGSFTVVVTSADGCSASATTTVTGSTAPPQNVNLTASGPLSCTTTTVTLTGSSTGGTNYVFSGPGVTAQGSTTATVNQAGTYTVVVTGANGCSASATTTVTSNTATVVVSNPATNVATVGTAFSQTVTASSGTGPYSFSINSGSLPDGLSLATNGTISGSPTATGSFTITVRATDANGCSGVGGSYVITVTNAVPTVTGLTANPDPSCVGNRLTFTATVGNVTGSYNFTLTNGSINIPGTSSSSAFSQTLISTMSGFQTFTLTVSSNGQSASDTYEMVITAPPAFTLTASNGGTLTCGQTSLTLSVGETDFAVFSGPGIVSQDGGMGIAVVNAAGVYSVTVTDSEVGCSSVASTTVSSNTATPSLSINPSSYTLSQANPTVSLTAVGTGTYKWSTGATSQVISVTSSGTYSVTLTSPGSCTATASVPVAGADLTVTLDLPEANFTSSGTASVGNFVVNVYEVGGLPTSSGNVRITVTVPVGYTLSFAPGQTSINVTGGTTTTVNNSQWTVSNTLAGRQMTLTMNSGAFISAGGTSRLGFSITRTTASSGSTSNITVNVADDLTMSYDANLANNGYARIISGL
ncbi:beta strand repeat-containing protein [Spirosoma litoris]